MLGADHRGDLACADALEGFPGLGVHLEDAGDDLLLPVDRVEDAGALGDPSGVDAQIGQGAVLIGDDLEDQCAEWRVLGVRPGELLPDVAGIGPLDGGDLGGVGQVLYDAVEEPLDPDVAQRRPAEDRRAAQSDRPRAQRRPDLVGRDRRLVLEVPIGEGLVQVGGLLEKLVVALAGLLDERIGDGSLLDPGAEFAGVEVIGGHVQEIDDALEIVPGSDRELHGDGVGPQPVSHRAEAEIEVRPDLVHFVDEADARDPVAIRLAPDGLGLGLHAFLGVEYADHAVEDAQRSLHLDGEVDVARRVDEVDRVGLPAVLPEAGRRGRLDGDAAPLLLLQEVHDRGALVHLPHLVAASGVEEDALSDRGLARVDVGTDTDIANFGEVNGHGLMLRSRRGPSQGLGRLGWRRDRVSWRGGPTCAGRGTDRSAQAGDGDFVRQRSAPYTRGQGGL